MSVRKKPKKVRVNFREGRMEQARRRRARPRAQARNGARPIDSDLGDFWQEEDEFFAPLHNYGWGHG